ncbi:MAG: septum formation protein Maf [Saprospiraceae bacterium]|nr:septum formation protein Maf [Saprospiraceae bacterium]
MYLIDKKIILASKSPRRKQLMEAAGFRFEIKTRDVDESFPDDMPKKEVAEYLAVKKAEACLDFLDDDDAILLTADSTVVMGEEIYNKPEDLADAKKMIRALAGKTHIVYTGVCLLDKNKRHSFSGVSEVIFDEMTDAEIDYYVENYEVLDKAGAYAIQEWIGLCKIKSIKGTYTNIMGLPVREVYNALKNWD